MTRVRAAVLASGGGSNLQAILDHLAVLGDARALDVVLVASDRPQAGALDRARRAGIPTEIVRTPKRPTERELGELLDACQVRLVVLAGYLRLVPPHVTQRHSSRTINVHPGPLPQFGGAGMYGQRVHRAVLDAGVPFSGPTVHLVDEIYDHGRQIAHWPVPVLANDDEHTLSARVLRAEHLLYPRIVQAVAAVIPSMDTADATGGARVLILPPFDPELDDAALARQVDDAIARW